MKTGTARVLADLAKHGVTAAKVNNVNGGHLADTALDLITLPLTSNDLPCAIRAPSSDATGLAGGDRVNVTYAKRHP